MAPWTPINQSLPNGTFRQSCTGCVRWEQSVQCTCLTRAAVDTGRGPPRRPGNLTGLYAVASTYTPPPPPPAGVLAGTPAEVEQEMLVWVQTQELAEGLGSFTVTCVAGGSFRACDPVAPPPGAPESPASPLGRLWHAGRGVLHAANGSLEIALDTGARLRGNLSLAAGPAAAFTVVAIVNGTASGVREAWQRQPPARRRTALSLSACRRPAALSNEDGYLSCDWKEVPPPRVGAISYGRTIDTTCRYLPHTTFIAPQYKGPGDPFVTAPSINLSSILSQTHTLSNISGLWTSFSRDGGRR
jgi:hypothetical protein